jgi:hypothetical protein
LRSEFAAAPSGFARRLGARQLYGATVRPSLDPLALGVLLG